LPQTNIFKSEQISAIAKELSFNSAEELAAQVGFGKVSPRQIVGRLKPKLGIKKTSRKGWSPKW